MNRSILIVTCDFLVLAAMSLSIGMNEVEDPAGEAHFSSPATRLVEMIDEELARHEEVLQQKDELAQRVEEFRALLLKDEKKLLSKDEEIKAAQAKLAETLAALSESKDELTSEKSKSEQELAKSAAELAKTKKDLDEREAALKRSAAVIEQKEKELNISAQELVERDKVIRDSENLLEASERSLARVTQEKAAETEKLQQSEKTLSRTSGQLEATRLELQALREVAKRDRARAEEAIAKFHAAEVELAETKTKLSSAQAQLDGTVRVLADVNSDLTKTKTELSESRQSLAVSRETIAQNERLISEKDKTIAKSEKIIDEKEKTIAQTEKVVEQKDKVIEYKDRDLTATRQKADELEKMLTNDVLTSYNASALELSFHIVNDRLFNNIAIDKSFFLPAVKLGGKAWLVSAFRDTTGLSLHSGYTKVTELQYKVRRPQSKDKWSAVNGPALCLAEDARVCLYPVAADKAEPIQAITFGALRERGLDNLTLFKSATFSKDSADITGRCSVSMEEGDNYLYIRNPNRSSSELKAEVGDIVLSKEGLFVGVVVKVSSTDLGQTSTAKCFVFTGEPALAKATQLRLTKEPSQTLYYDFVDKHESLRRITDQLDRTK